MDIITYAAVSGSLLLPCLLVCFFLYLNCKFKGQGPFSSCAFAM